MDYQKPNSEEIKKYLTTESVDIREYKSQLPKPNKMEDVFDWCYKNDKFKRLVTMMSMNSNSDGMYTLLLMLLTDVEYFYIKIINELEEKINMMNVNRNNKFTDGLRPGGYIAQIRAVRCEENGRVLNVRFDIVEGELKGFFKKSYDENPQNGWDRKGSSKFDLNQEYGEKILNRFLDDVEKSNVGYFWDGDENKLVNKKIGVVYANNTYINNDGETKHGTGFPRFMNVQAVRNGDYSIEEKGKKNTAPAPAITTAELTEDDIQF